MKLFQRWNEKSLTGTGIPVIGVSDVTGFPEILDGRVKTLNPNIHGGLLAKYDEPRSYGNRLNEHKIDPIQTCLCKLISISTND